MTRTIVAVSPSTELTGRHAQLARQIQTRLNKAEAVDLTQLRKACRSMKPKRFRAIIRELAAARVIKIAVQ